MRILVSSLLLTGILISLLSLHNGLIVKAGKKEPNPCITQMALDFLGRFCFKNANKIPQTKVTSDGPGMISLIMSLLEKKIEVRCDYFHGSSGSHTGVCMRITWKDC